MIIGTAIHLVDEDCDGNKTIFLIGDTINIKVRNYLAENGYILYTGRLDSIFIDRIRIDISESGNSHFEVIYFNNIISIEHKVTEEEEAAVTFGSEDKEMINVTIPKILMDILMELKRFHKPHPKVIINK